jgi:hypothetical protein
VKSPACVAALVARRLAGLPGLALVVRRHEPHRVPVGQQCGTVRRDGDDLVLVPVVVGLSVQHLGLGRGALGHGVLGPRHRRAVVVSLRSTKHQGDDHHGGDRSRRHQRALVH